jgi:hypothetical protein
MSDEMVMKCRVLRNETDINDHIPNSIDVRHRYFTGPKVQLTLCEYGLFFTSSWSDYVLDRNALVPCRNLKI